MPLRHIGGVDVYLHAFLTCPLDGGEWLVSHLGCCTPRERAPVIHCIEDGVDCRTGLDVVAKRKIFDTTSNQYLVVQPIGSQYTD